MTYRKTCTLCKDRKLYTYFTDGRDECNDCVGLSRKIHENFTPESNNMKFLGEKIALLHNAFENQKVSKVTLKKYIQTINKLYDELMKKEYSIYFKLRIHDETNTYILNTIGKIPYRISFNTFTWHVNQSDHYGKTKIEHNLSDENLHHIVEDCNMINRFIKFIGVASQFIIEYYIKLSGNLVELHPNIIIPIYDHESSTIILTYNPLNLSTIMFIREIREHINEIGIPLEKGYETTNFVDDIELLEKMVILP